MDRENHKIDEHKNNSSDDESTDQSDNSDHGSWMSDHKELTTCLFCSKEYPSIEDAMLHLKHGHNVNIAALKAKFRMDQYSFIKLINYLRMEKSSAEKITNATEAFWNDEKYLKPVKYETWLSYDYEEMPEESTIAMTGEFKLTTNDDATKHIQSLYNKIRELSIMLEQAGDDMRKMRTSYQRLLEKDSSLTGQSNNGCIADVHRYDNDATYFESYAHFDIHREMLSDSIRTTAYRDAFMRNKDFFAGKDVLDVGCGTAILSMFAAQAGARTIIGIDNADVVYKAMDIVRKNNMHNITLVKGRLEDTFLPQEKFDVIISEWMGYFLLFEGMMDSIIYARKKHLRPGGMILPNRCTMSLLGYGHMDLYKRHITFWNDVYGFDMSAMCTDIRQEPLVEVVNPDHILTEPEIIASFDLNAVDVSSCNFTHNFHLKCTKDGMLTSFVGYFDAYFDLPEAVMFSTGPTDQPTHWKQVVFFVDEPMPVRISDVIVGAVTCRQGRNSKRSLSVTIEVHGKKYLYHMD